MGLFFGMGLVGAAVLVLSAPQSSDSKDKDPRENRYAGALLLVISCLVLDILAAGAAAGMGGAILDGKFSASTELGYALIGYGAGTGALALLILPLGFRALVKGIKGIGARNNTSRELAIAKAEAKGRREAVQVARAAPPAS